jgi:hypothetical protein
MRSPFSRPRPVRSEVGLIVRSAMKIHTRELVQTQYLSEHYVLTELERMLLLFWPERGRRFAVDRVRRELKPLDVSAQLAQAAQLRAAIGEVRMEPAEGEEEIAGFTCRRLVMRNESPVIVLEGELCYTRLPRLADTAIAREREFDAALQPFAAPLAPDELVVRSTMRLLARGFEQSQRTELQAVETRPEGFEELDRILTYTLVD